jgi:hypothetical protein
MTQLYVFNLLRDRSQQQGWYATPKGIKATEVSKFMFVLVFSMNVNLRHFMYG